MPAEVKEAELDELFTFTGDIGRYEVSEGKPDTYSVEAENAELRH